jgi:ABC-type antimicrobial peptide transport system permease subunit
MGLDAASAVGKRFKHFGLEGPIVGVVKNFHYQSVGDAIGPLAIVVTPKRPEFAVVRLRAGEIPAALEDVRASWRRLHPFHPFEPRFFDEDFAVMFRADERTGSLLKAFAGLAVAVAGLGLFGLAAFTAERRTREIGVRKVLGASSAGIVRLLSAEFVKWVLAANILAWPIAYLVMTGWLRRFAYRAPIAWWLFAAAGAGGLAVALLSVGFQALRAAHADPVRALKYE